MVNLSLKLVDKAETGDHYLAIVDNNKTLTVGGGAYTNETTIDLTGTNTTNIRAGMAVSGTYIPDGATVTAVISATRFIISETTTNGEITGDTLTFTKPSGIYMYSKNHDKWSRTITVPIEGSSIESTFYQVEGAIRIVDASLEGIRRW